MSSLSDVVGGVAINYISNNFLKKLEEINGRNSFAKFKTALEEWAINFEKNHDGTIATSSEFIGYVKNYHIVEEITRYTIYPKSTGIDEQKFLDGLLRNMINSFEEGSSRKLSLEDKSVIADFLNSILAQTKDFVTQQLPSREQAILYSLCQLQIKENEISLNTDKKLSQIIDIIQKPNIPKEDETQLPPDFDQLILDCNDTLRRSMEKVKVYSWDDLSFMSVYVLPSLKIDMPPFARHAHFRENNNIALTSLLSSKNITLLYDTLNSVLSDEDIDSFFETNYFERRQALINSIFSYSHIIYVIGGAGYGKSLFLQSLCVSPSMLDGYDDTPFLIIRGDLKRMIQSDGMFKSMRQFLEECLVHTSLKKPDEFPPNFLHRCLKAGRCLILLDALDEVGNDQRNELHQRVISYFQGANSSNRVCITSRDRGFIPAKDIVCFSICPITDRDVGEYVDRFIALDKFPEEERDRFIQQATGLVNKGFVRGFLTLSLLLAIYKNEEELPANKVALYEKCFEYIAASREKRKKLLRNSSTGEEYDWIALDKLMNEATFAQLAQLGTPNNRDIIREQIDDLMTELYKTRFQNATECRAAIDMFLQFCADRTEVFVPSPNSNLEYRFFHRSFYDYFYAHCLFQFSDNPKEIYEKLYVFDVDSEIFELLIALYYRKKPAQARGLLKYAFEQAEAQLQQGTDEAGKVFDILIMLMQAADENDYTERFIDLFMEHGDAISHLNINARFNLIGKVFTQNLEHFNELYQDGQKTYELKISRGVARMLLKNRPELNRVLKKKTTFIPVGWDSEHLEGFRYYYIVGLFPNRMTVMEQIFNNLKSPQYVRGTLKMRNKGIDEVSAFADKVCSRSVKEQRRIYSLLISLM